MNLLRNQKMQAMPYQQRGALLIVGLVMVLLMTIVGMAAIRGTGLQENMAGNMRVRNIAFQASESALRGGESFLLSKAVPEATPECTGGVCTDLDSPPAGSVLYWSDAKWIELGVKIALDVKDISAAPRYIVEELKVDIGASAAAEGSAIDVAGMQTTGDATPYRVTAKGTGISAEAGAIVQSTFKLRF